MWRKINSEQLPSNLPEYWEHACRVAKWVKTLGGERKDSYLLITAAYLHDIGWSGVAPPERLHLDELLRLQPKANENSSAFITEVLSTL